jgi:AcrR family transcriptional regulator
MPRARGPRAGPKRRGEESRERILDAALALFRREGFDAATMRDVAAAAGMSLGAAYYYFPSKEAIVLGYYEKVFAERRRRARAAFAESESLRDRLRAVYLLHFDGVRRDRKLLGALVRSVADPDSQVSVFSGATEAVRRGSIALFREAVSLPEVPEELRDLGALGLWTLDLALMLYFIWDDSPEQARTRRLIDDAIDMLLPMVPLLSMPLAAGLRAELERMLVDARLLSR